MKNWTRNRIIVTYHCSPRNPCKSEKSIKTQTQFSILVLQNVVRPCKKSRISYAYALAFQVAQRISENVLDNISSVVFAHQKWLFLAFLRSRWTEDTRWWERRTQGRCSKMCRYPYLAMLPSANTQMKRSTSTEIKQTSFYLEILASKENHAFYYVPIERLPICRKTRAYVYVFVVDNESSWKHKRMYLQ